MCKIAKKNTAQLWHKFCCFLNADYAGDLKFLTESRNTAVSVHFKKQQHQCYKMITGARQIMLSSSTAIDNVAVSVQTDIF